MALPTWNGWNIVTMPSYEFQSIDFVSTDTIGVFTSPYTNQMQVYDWQNSFLSGTVTLPPQEAGDAAAWIGFLLACRGSMNVFELGDSSQTEPFGTPSGSPVVAAAPAAYSATTAYAVGNTVNYSGNTYICIAATTGNAPTDTTYWALDNQFHPSAFPYGLYTTGWGASANGLLLPGDYITIPSAPVNPGDETISRLYRITQPVNSDASGNATISIWPQIRETPAAAVAITTSNTRGLFRLAQNKVQWHKSYDTTMQASFAIVEAL
ncbi:MAG TPA: hypothetical protein VFN53_06410 [Acidobacteriaceae bacterium]|nr:hypothetical protein [Acidobacteriaceae bacterium]